MRVSGEAWGLCDLCEGGKHPAGPSPVELRTGQQVGSVFRGMCRINEPSWGQGVGGEGSKGRGHDHKAERHVSECRGQ